MKFTFCVGVWYFLESPKLKLNFLKKNFLLIQSSTPPARRRHSLVVKQRLIPLPNLLLQLAPIHYMPQSILGGSMSLAEVDGVRLCGQMINCLMWLHQGDVGA